jgi:hypothetical protein
VLKNGALSAIACLLAQTDWPNVLPAASAAEQCAASELAAGRGQATLT